MKYKYEEVKSLYYTYPHPLKESSIKFQKSSAPENI